MSYPNNRSSAYKESSVLTASPTKLVVLLYDKAIRCLRRGAEDIRTRNLVSKRQSIGQAIAIIQHLQRTLDTTRGQEIAHELNRLYAYTLSRILAGSTKLDPKPIEEAIKVLSPLLMAWEKVAEKQEETTVPGGLLMNRGTTGGFQLQA